MLYFKLFGGILFESFRDIISTYGYYAVFLFACIEGEVALITAGFLAKHGYLSIQNVIFVAFLGTVIFEQIVYFVGRLHGRKLLAKFPKYERNAKRAMAFLRKYNTAFLFWYRFIYGIRNISPLIIGMARVPKFKYAIVNVFASIIWATTIAGIGYLFAEALESASSGVQIFQKVLLAIFILVPAVYFFMKNKKR